MKLLNYMIIVLGLMTASAFSHAGVVKKVANKGNKKLVLIQLEGESVKKKDILLVEKNGRLCKFLGASIWWFSWC